MADAKMSGQDVNESDENLVKQPHSDSNIFEKKYLFQKQSDKPWVLPPAKETFQGFYQLESLQKLKQQLNDVKSKLNDYPTEAWSAHTRRKDPAGEIPWRLKNETKAEFVTVAWCKLYECLHKFPALIKCPKFNSLHLCEAPGAFITSLNHYLHSTFPKEEIKWKWLATTLNPYYEGNPLNKMIIDDRFILNTFDNWLFYDDFTGNIMNTDNLSQMQRQCEERLVDGVHFITADGSVDCFEMPDFQEETVSQLHFTELTAALSILANGGSFLLKMFTLFEAASVSKLYLLNCVFEKVAIYKPATSKRGNSEIYVICIGYQKNTPNLSDILQLMRSKIDKNNILPLFTKSQLPPDFLMQHEICTRFFMNYQIQAIESNIFSYEIQDRQEVKRTHELRTHVSNEFFKRYQIQPIPIELNILHGQRGIIQTGARNFLYKGSHTERKMTKLKMTQQQQLFFQLRGNLNDLERQACKRFNILLSETFPNEQNLENDGKPWETALRFHYGKPFDILYSSLFADVHLLYFLFKLEEYTNRNEVYAKHGAVYIHNDDGVTHLLYEQRNENFMKTQQDIFSKILNIIIEKQPTGMKFDYFLFLTHYAVSFVRYLVLLLAKKFIITTENANFQIILHFDLTRYDDVDIMAKLKTLLQRMRLEKHILCFMKIEELHRNEFSTAIKEFNNLLLLNIFDYILNKVK